MRPKTNNYKSRTTHNFGRPWTPKEMEILTKYYPREGPKGTKERLAKLGYERSKHAIVSKANHNMILVGEIPGYVIPSHVLGSCGSTSYYIMLFQACRDRVLLELPNKSTKYAVPEEWADAYVERLFNRNPRSHE